MWVPTSSARQAQAAWTRPTAICTSSTPSRTREPAQRDPSAPEHEQDGGRERHVGRPGVHVLQQFGVESVAGGPPSPACGPDPVVRIPTSTVTATTAT